MDEQLAEPLFNPSFVIPILYTSLAVNIILIFMWCRLISKIRMVCNIIDHNSRIIVDNSVKIVTEPELQDESADSSNPTNKQGIDDLF